MFEIELLDAAKRITGSDSATARRIGTSRQRIGHVRTGTHHMDEWIAGELAEIIGESPLKAVCKLREELASTHKEKTAWQRWANVAIIILGIGVICASGEQSITYALFPAFLPIHYAYLTLGVALAVSVAYLNKQSKECQGWIRFS